MLLKRAKVKFAKEMTPFNLQPCHFKFL